MDRLRIIILCVFVTLLSACTSVDIEPGSVDRFEQRQYSVYSWRTEPLPQGKHSTDPLYALDPVIRAEVDKDLAAKGYVKDRERAQFTVEYLYAVGIRDGAKPEQANNITPYPSATINRRVDQASVDNAIALGGVKETSNVILTFKERNGGEELWRASISQIVEDANKVDNQAIVSTITQSMERALSSVPKAPVN